jgi:hypothetical protein
MGTRPQAVRFRFPGNSTSKSDLLEVEHSLTRCLNEKEGAELSAL